MYYFIISYYYIFFTYFPMSQKNFIEKTKFSESEFLKFDSYLVFRGMGNGYNPAGANT